MHHLTVTLKLMGAMSLAHPAMATATESQPITLETVKAKGPVAGTFDASGAFTDSGAINNLSIHVAHTPTFVATLPTILFTGNAGTFTIKAQIKETVTTDPAISTNAGTWVVTGGTGAYADLRGKGIVTGTTNDHVGLINRTYSGLVRLDSDAFQFRTVP